jgi:hypothetical protein
MEHVFVSGNAFQKFRELLAVHGVKSETIGWLCTFEGFLDYNDVLLKLDQVETEPAC